MDKKEAEVAASQGVSTWNAFVFYVMGHLALPSFLLPFQVDR